ncbi:hypothetical protein K435DRAFT_750810 [Dendrothele bispora CBS 962.96]|uniref:DNA mismatch repair proteins mutS family domain-containing protein n=1 Tax=Dendrothele bispora (strain CBS 962.96) TaxID=1314807 RepID=A0A4V4HH08_DENBC|nr:hypothetical protein K435DRAFT_750810 [Dendrothele bispora CBS 962.96]
MILEQASPDVALTSSRSDDLFIDTVRDFMDSSGGILQIRPYKEFSATRGRDRLLSLQFLSDLSCQDADIMHPSESSETRSKNAYDFMKKRVIGDPATKKWNASIRLSNFVAVESSPLCMSSVGALIDYLVREHAMANMDDENLSSLEVRDIEFLALNEVMQINMDALFSLQVFENESHASIHSDKTKEGLSLAGVLNNTHTSLGRALMRMWLLRPSLSLNTIRARHDAVECFLSVENLSIINSLHGHLKGIKNIPRMLGILKTGHAKVSDWQGLVKFTVICVMLKETLSELHDAGSIEIVKKVISALDIVKFRDIGTRINDIIDWEESAESGRVCVRPRIDEELDKRKHVYHGIDSILSKVAERICQAVPSDYASTLNIVYFPQLGFLICVPMREEWSTESGIQVLDGWSFQFSSESHVYFKSQEMHDMDAYIGDLHSLVVDREIEIVQNLSEEILVHYDAMSNTCDVCAELDCLLAFADASNIGNYRRPEMVEENIIDIAQGRHPLQEMVVDTFVPNNTRLAGGLGNGVTDDDTEMGGRHSIVLCTGPNACGKSVYLKQVALIQYMAQIGCFVPAERATLGIVDKIFTRVSTRESVSKVQSAFMIDLNQVSLALRNSTPRSLILLDEFGKGTLPTGSSSFYEVSSYGAGLLCGVIKHFLSRKEMCPKVLVTTHFHEIFRQDLLDPKSVPISFQHMQVMFTQAGAPSSSVSRSGGADPMLGPGDEITYLYRLAEGLSLDSHAAKCAEVFGIPSRFVKRAQRVSQLISAHEIGQLLDEAMSKEDVRDLEDAEAVCRRFLAWNLQEEQEDVKTRLGKVLGKVDNDNNDIGNDAEMDEDLKG